MRNRKITIRTGAILVEAELNNSPTADLIWEVLPIEAEVNTWGDELYFEIPVTAALERDAQEVVQVGDLGYWPTSRALCIFFGPTPVSRGNEIRPASAVNLVGKVIGDAKIFKSVTDGDAIKIDRVTME